MENRSKGKTFAREKMSKKKKIKKRDFLAAYHDPAASGRLGGVRRFAQAQGITVDQAKTVLEKDLGYTLHKPRRQRFEKLPVVAEGLDHQWVADLVEVQKLAKYNRGYRYLLTVIDVLSKYAWVQPLKDKTGVQLVKALEKILKTGRRPIQLQTDPGKEFYNKMFQQFLEKEGIHHFSMEGDAKASVVERFNRTLKTRMYRYLTSANTLRYEDVLPSLVRGYNATKHGSIGLPPQDVTLKNERRVWQRLYGRRLTPLQKQPRFRVGDRVRLNKNHRTFEKGYLPGLTKEVITVDRVIRGPIHTYKIRELDDTPLQGTFYEQDLQKVYVDDDAVFRVEKVLKQQKGQALVKWKGWPDKDNSWVASKDLKTL